MRKTIVSLMAHADDLEESAGGTFAKYLSEGYEGLIIVLSRCNSGWNGIPDRDEYISSLEIVPQRRREARAAADVFGAEFYMGDLLENNYTLRSGRRIVPGFTGPRPIFSEGDEAAAGIRDDDIPSGTLLAVAAGFGSYPPVHPEIRRVVDLLVSWEPELTLIQEMGNYNPDHLAAAQIGAMAWTLAAQRVQLGPLWLPVPHPRLSPRAFPPLKADRWVDVTGFEETNLRALACHVCQGGASAETQEHVRTKWRTYGIDHGVESAEGFTEVFPASGPES